MAAAYEQHRPGYPGRAGRRGAVVRRPPGAHRPGDRRRHRQGHAGLRRARHRGDRDRPGRRHAGRAAPARARHGDDAAGGVRGRPVTATYDLVLAAAAMHWTDPVGRWERVAALLVPGGTFASFGGQLDLADAAVEEAVASAQAPYLVDDAVASPDGTDPGAAMQWPGTELQASALFADVRQVVLERRLTLTADGYVAHLATISAYLQLAAARARRGAASHPCRAAARGGGGRRPDPAPRAVGRAAPVNAESPAAPRGDRAHRVVRAARSGGSEDQERSKRSSSMTLVQAATKSRDELLASVVAGVDLGQRPQLRVRPEDQVDRRWRSTAPRRCRGRGSRRRSPRSASPSSGCRGTAGW